MKTPDIETKTTISSRNKLLWVLLITFGTLTYFAGYCFPPTLKIQNKYLPICPTTVYNQLGYQCGYFDSETNPILAMEAENLNSSNVFIQLEAYPTLEENKLWNREINLKYELSIFAVNKKHDPIKEIHIRQQTQASFYCNEKPETYCPPQSLAEINKIENDRYLFVIKLLNTKDMTISHVKDLKLVFVTVNPEFENYLTYFKWVLFAFAIVGFVIYRTSLVKISREFTSAEQKCVTIMGFFLIFFTQPFVKHSSLSANHIFSLISMGVSCGMSSILIAFWLTLLERLSSDDGTISGAKNVIIKLFALVLFVISFGGYGTFTSHQDNNPLLDFQNDASFEVTVCRLSLYGLLFVVCIWTLFRMIVILPNIKELDWRDSTSLTFTFCYLICYMFFMGTGSFQAVNFKGARVVLLYGISTLYTLLLQIMYAPLENEVEEAEEMRKYENKEAKGQYGNLEESSEVQSPGGEDVEMGGHQKASQDDESYED